MRGVLASRPSEAALLAFMLGGLLIVLAGKIIQIQILYASPEDRNDLVQSEAYAMLFWRSLAYYGMAALATLIARACGGQGAWKDGRAAFFWAVLVSAPVLLLSALLPLLLTGVPPEVATVTAQVGAVFFTWALAQCFAETFGFARTWIVCAAFCAPALLIFAAGWLMRG